MLAIAELTLTRLAIGMRTILVRTILAAGMPLIIRLPAIAVTIAITAIPIPVVAVAIAELIGPALPVVETLAALVAILPVMAILPWLVAALQTVSVHTLGAFWAFASFKRRLWQKRLRLVAAHHRRLLTTGLVAVVGKLVVVEVVLQLRDAEALPHAAMHVAAALTDLLFAEGKNDAIVVFGVLKIILRQHLITGRFRIPCQRDILLGDMGGRAANLDIRPVRLERPGQRILTFAVLLVTTIAVVIIIIAAAAATAAMLMSLPHGLPFSIVIEQLPNPERHQSAARHLHDAPDPRRRRGLAGCPDVVEQP